MKQNITVPLVLLTDTKLVEVVGQHCPAVKVSIVTSPLPVKHKFQPTILSCISTWPSSLVDTTVIDAAAN